MVIHYRLEALLMSIDISMFSWRNRQKEKQLFLRFLHVFWGFFFVHVLFNFVICFCLIQIPQYNLRHRRSKSNGDDLVLDHRPSGLLNLGKDISPAILLHNFHVFFKPVRVCIPSLLNILCNGIFKGWLIRAEKITDYQSCHCN